MAASVLRRVHYIRACGPVMADYSKSVTHLVQDHVLGAMPDQDVRQVNNGPGNKAGVGVVPCVCCSRRCCTSRVAVSHPKSLDEFSYAA